MREYEQIAAIYRWTPAEMAELPHQMRQWWFMAAVRRGKRIAGDG